MSFSYRILCAWCADLIHDGTDTKDAPKELSHGICIKCCREYDLMDVVALETFGGDDFDRLPFGVIELDEDGIVLSYNKAEAELSGLDAKRVVGRDFFNSVAPCANVNAFAGKYRELISANVTARIQLDFVFVFEDGEIIVDIVILFNKLTRTSLILVKKAQNN